MGRETELELLREDNWRDHGLLVVLYGRRRVGKTALIEEAFREDVVWKFEGIENAKLSVHISFFLEQLSHYTGCPEESASTWADCFRLLEAAIADQSKRHPRKRFVVFFDEFQWMCSMQSSLVAEFKFFWDNYFAKHRNTVFVICGSISSFIVKKVVQSTALYGRVDLELHLQPLSPGETRALFSKNRPPEELLQTQLLFGGIPQYLVALHPKRSLIQNVNEEAFKPSGYFFQEFDRLFLSHFAKNSAYKKILQRLAKSTCSSAEIGKAIGMSTGGTLTNLLEDLELAGFIDRYTPVGKGGKSRLVRYRILDEYLHFYFSLILPNARNILTGSIQYAKLSQSRDFSQWLGYAFERFCQRNAASIADLLKFSGIAYESGSWFRRSDKTTPGSQVDLLFVRADKMISACEIKHVRKPQPKKWAAEMELKKEALAEAFPGYGVESVLLIGQGEVEELARWFDHVIPAERLF